MNDRRKPILYIIAGEDSGDRLGGALMSALIQKTGGNIEFTGIGGTKMTAQGLDSLFPIEDLAVMGLTEVVSRLPKLLQRIEITVKDVVKKNPSALITIDAPDFNFRVAKKLKDSEIPLIHYVAPTVWAWRPGRAYKVAQFLDHLLTILPFEAPYFKKYGLDTTYVGHPVLQNDAETGDPLRLRNQLNIDLNRPILTVLPGSRTVECSHMLPIFADVVHMLKNHIDNFDVIIPVVSSVKEQVIKNVADWKVQTHILDSDQSKFDAFAATRLALATSGTVALELAISGTPAVIGYRVAPITAFLAKHLVATKYVNLVNILLEREAVPEFVLEQCRAELILNACLSIWNSNYLQSQQKEAYQHALKKFELTKNDLEFRAADTVLSVIKEKNSRDKT
ncbi:MAG: lipid-A-disaccharide synthase [Rhodospirillaceae bacterium TMED8]|nr:lipid-A-disaccharide synthase [Magnetovibrio sp.]OUT51659.1 MAG: lipid-A-disaccharide synthase [Rhodospirillaceae bacterium TMED8]